MTLLNPWYSTTTICPFPYYTQRKQTTSKNEIGNTQTNTTKATKKTHLPDPVSGVPDQDIDRAEVSFDRRNRFVDIFRHGDVAGKALAVGNVFGGGDQLFQLARHDGNLVSLGGPFSCDRGPNFWAKAKDGTNLGRRRHCCRWLVVEEV